MTNPAELLSLFEEFSKIDKLTPTEQDKLLRKALANTSSSISIQRAVCFLQKLAQKRRHNN
jgi:uncharacterized protein Smg (DUF494 family)